MKVIVENKHSLMARWNHWVNFPVLAVMTWSGLMIYWADPAFLLPRSWLEKVNLQYKLGLGLAWHFTFAWLFIANGAVYLTYMFLSRDYRHLWPSFYDLRNVHRVVLFDLGLTKQAPVQEGKYNSAQKFAYALVLLIGIAAALTGLAIYKPIQLGWLVKALGGYHAARLEHFICMIAFLLFFIVHVIQVIRAGLNNLNSMITGLERKNVGRTTEQTTESAET